MPTAGYANAFSRLTYCMNMPLQGVLTNAMENIHAFDARSHFSFISLIDSHNLLTSLPDISMSIASTLDMLDFSYTGEGASPFHAYNLRSIRQQVNTLAYMDFHLGRLYDFIENSYRDDEICVALISDHGKGFLSPYQHILSTARMRVPLFIRNEEFYKRFDYDAAFKGERISSNVDILPTIAELCEVEVPFNDGASLLSKTPRNFALSESIFKGQTYKARLSFKDFAYMYESREAISYKDAIFTPRIDMEGKSFLLDEANRQFHDADKEAEAFWLLKGHIGS